MPSFQWNRYLHYDHFERDLQLYVYTRQSAQLVVLCVCSAAHRFPAASALFAERCAAGVRVASDRDALQIRHEERNRLPQFIHVHALHLFHHKLREATTLLQTLSIKSSYRVA